MKHKVKLKAVFTLLSLLSVVLIPIHAQAMSCVIHKTYEQALDKADVVFEGHFVKLGLLKLSSAELSENKTNRPISNFNSTYFIKETYVADKGWKGIAPGQEVDMVFPMPQDKPLSAQLLKEGEAVRLNKENRIYAFEEIKNEGIFKEKLYYDNSMCGGRYDITAENIKVLQKKFPAVIQ